MTIFDAQQTIELLEKQVTGREDYVYEKPRVPVDFGGVVEEITISDCAYSTPGGSPSCLVGHVLRDVMDDDEWNDVCVSEYDEHGRFKAGIGIMYLHGVTHLFTGSAIHALSRAQRVQDRGGTWGEALSAARSTVIA